MLKKTLKTKELTPLQKQVCDILGKNPKFTIKTDCPYCSGDGFITYYGQCDHCRGKGYTKQDIDFAVIRELLGITHI